MKAFAAAASSKVAQEAAEEALLDRGTAADAVAAAWFALAGERSDVFTAPFSAVVAGPAAVGARVRWPRASSRAGRPEAARTPRGRDDPAGRVCHGAAGTRLGPSARGDLWWTRSHQGDPIGSARGEGWWQPGARPTLERVLAAGAATLSSFEEEILGVVGRTNGGYITSQDLAAEAGQSAARIRELRHGETRVQLAEEPSDELAESAWFGSGARGTETESVVAVDHRGTLAAATFNVGFASHDARTLEIPSLGISWCLGGAPPRHAQPRIKPGTPVDVARTLLAVDAGASARMAVAFAPNEPPSAPDLDGEEELAAWVRSLGARARVSVLATSNGASGRAVAAPHG